MVGKDGGIDEALATVKGQDQEVEDGGGRHDGVSVGVGVGVGA